MTGRFDRTPVAHFTGRAAGRGLRAAALLVLGSLSADPALAETGASGPGRPSLTVIPKNVDPSAGTGTAASRGAAGSVRSPRAGTTIIERSGTPVDGGSKPPEQVGEGSKADGWAASVTGATAMLRNVTLSSSGPGEATLLVEVAGQVRPRVRKLEAPYRIVIDFDDLDPAIKSLPLHHPVGPVAGLRWGSIASGRTRIVLDCTVPLEPGDLQRIQSTTPGVSALRFSFRRTTIDAYRPTPSEPADPVSVVKASAPEPAEGPARRSALPVIVVDPGHGGVDSGAVGRHAHEKDIALAVAKRIVRRLRDARTYEVVTTRASDVFVSLDRRLRISREAGSELFVSIHTDSIADKGWAGSIRGASAYMLSERASDERARLKAEKENASDILAGLEGTSAQASDALTSILIDLMQRESASLSASFQHGLLEMLSRRITLAKGPRRAAAFKVLKQAHTPAVLIELGYVSNPEDEAMLISPEWQGRVADLVVAAIDRHFAERRSGKLRLP